MQGGQSNRKSLMRLAVGQRKHKRQHRPAGKYSKQHRQMLFISMKGFTTVFNWCLPMCLFWEFKCCTLDLNSAPAIWLHFTHFLLRLSCYNFFNAWLLAIKESHSFHKWINHSRMTGPVFFLFSIFNHNTSQENIAVFTHNM